MLNSAPWLGRADYPALPHSVSPPELLDNPDMLERVFRSVLAADPDDGRVHNDLGTALMRLERYEEAAASFQKAAAVLPDVKDIRRFSTLHPDGCAT